MCYRPSSCLAAAKASMLVVQRSQEPISATLQATHLYCTLQLTLSGLLDCYTHILTDGEDRVCYTRGVFTRKPTETGRDLNLSNSKRFLLQNVLG